MNILLLVLVGFSFVGFLLGYSVCSFRKNRRRKRLQNRIKQLVELNGRLKQALRDGIYYYNESLSWTPHQPHIMTSWCRRVNHLTAFDNH